MMDYYDKRKLKKTLNNCAYSALGTIIAIIIMRFI